MPRAPYTDKEGLLQGSILDQNADPVKEMMLRQVDSAAQGPGASQMQSSGMQSMSPENLPVPTPGPDETDPAAHMKNMILGGGGVDIAGLGGPSGATPDISMIQSLMSKGPNEIMRLLQTLPEEAQIRILNSLDAATPSPKGQNTAGTDQFPKSFAPSGPRRPEEFKI